MSTKQKTQARLISKPDVLERTDLSYPFIWRLMLRGEFPRSLQVGGKTCWYEHEIDAWINNLPRRKLKGDAA